MALAPGALLSYVSQAERERLLACGVHRRFAAGDVLLHEGDPSDFVHVIVSGWVRVSTLVADGQEVLYGLCGPGDVLGELAALHGWARTASVRAIESVTVAQFTSAQFHTNLSTHPELAIALLKSLAVRLREAESARVAAASLDVSGRVAVLLGRLATEHGTPTEDGVLIAVPITQQDLANQIGASRRAVARALSVLRDRGIVVTARGTLLLREPDVLAALARTAPHGT